MSSTITTPLEMRLYSALKRIAQYQSPESLYRNCWRDWGLEDGAEAVGMAYENVRLEAKSAIKGLRVKKVAKP